MRFLGAMQRSVDAIAAIGRDVRHVTEPPSHGFAVPAPFQGGHGQRLKPKKEEKLRRLTVRVGVWMGSEAVPSAFTATMS